MLLKKLIDLILSKVRQESDTSDSEWNSDAIYELLSAHKELIEIMDLQAQSKNSDASTS